MPVLYSLGFRLDISQIMCDCIASVAGMGGNQPPADAPVVDTAEQVYISSLALLKMLKHGRAGEN